MLKDSEILIDFKLIIIERLIPCEIGEEVHFMADHCRDFIGITQVKIISCDKILFSWRKSLTKKSAHRTDGQRENG